MTLHVRVSNVPRGQKAKRWVNGFTPLPMVRRLTAGRTRRSTVPHVLSVEKKDKVTAGANRSTSRRIDPFCGISRTVRRATRGRAHSLTRRADRKSTRLNSSHGYISYAVFCLKKKIAHQRTEE